MIQLRKGDAKLIGFLFFYALIAVYVANLRSFL